MANITVTAKITEREIKISQLLADGNTVKQIAPQMQISRGAVDSYIHNLKVKLSVSTQGGLVAEMMRQKLVT